MESLSDDLLRYVLSEADLRSLQCAIAVSKRLGTVAHSTLRSVSWAARNSSDLNVALWDSERSVTTRFISDGADDTVRAHMIEGSNVVTIGEWDVQVHCMRDGCLLHSIVQPEADPVGEIEAACVCGSWIALSHRGRVPTVVHDVETGKCLELTQRGVPDLGFEDHAACLAWLRSWETPADRFLAEFCQRPWADAVPVGNDPEGRVRLWRIAKSLGSCLGVADIPLPPPLSSTAVDSFNAQPAMAVCGTILLIASATRKTVYAIDVSAGPNQPFCPLYIRHIEALYDDLPEPGWESYGFWSDAPAIHNGWVGLGRDDGSIELWRVNAGASRDDRDEEFFEIVSGDTRVAPAVPGAHPSYKPHLAVRSLDFDSDLFVCGIGGWTGYIKVISRSPFQVLRWIDYDDLGGRRLERPQFFGRHVALYDGTRIVTDVSTDREEMGVYDSRNVLLICDVSLAG